MRARRLLARAALYALVALILIVSIFPLYYALVTSFKSGTAIFRVDYWPTELSLANYASVLTTGHFPRNILNSIIVAGAVVVLALALGVSAAYALSRVRFRGRAQLMLLILSVAMFPQIAVLAGLFELIRFLGLYNTLAALVFSYMIFTLPFTVWVLTTFMRDLPAELEEAAIMDGASPARLLVSIFLPLLAPALVTTGLLAFIVAWNEFLFALTFTVTEAQRTVPVAIALITGATQFEIPWGNIMAASVIVTVPLIILVLIFQRRIVSGLTAGSVKG
jgi:trehalose/maltose transport system permease protein